MQILIEGEQRSFLVCFYVVVFVTIVIVMSIHVHTYIGSRREMHAVTQSEEAKQMCG